MDSEISVRFYGPYSWVGDAGADCIFDADLGKKPGLYLWTIKLTEGELIYYVGETGRSFQTRMLEHFREHMSGGYHVYDPEAFAAGRKVMLWPGRYDPEVKTTVSEFINAFGDLAEALVKLARMYRFYLAPLECEKRVRQRIEAALAVHLYRQDGLVGEAQDKGIRYTVRRAEEAPIGVRFESDTVLLGLPDSLSA